MILGAEWGRISEVCLVLLKVLLQHLPGGFYEVH
jgi:hypothetical protein